VTDPRDPGSTWWDFDPSEKPVPLRADAEAVLNEAHLTVTSAQRVLEREVTEPIQPSASRLDAGALRTEGRILKLSLCLLLSGCLVTAAIGWSQGSAARRSADPQARSSHAGLDGVIDVTKVTVFGSPRGSADGFNLGHGSRWIY